MQASVGVCYLEMSPQYHSASCRAMLLLKLLEGTGVDDFTGLGGKAATKTKREKRVWVSLHQAPSALVDRLCDKSNTENC